jgi:hypothetical protein
MTRNDDASYLLLDVIALLHAAFDLSGGGNLADFDQGSNDSTRIQSLLIMARDKAANVIQILDGRPVTPSYANKKSGAMA